MCIRDSFFNSEYSRSSIQGGYQLAKELFRKPLDCTAVFALSLIHIYAWLALAPRAVENLVSALLPALIGTAVCALTHLICHPQTVLAAYGWLLLLALASLVTMLLLLRGDSGASVLFLQLFGMMVPVPLLMGFGSS